MHQTFNAMASGNQNSAAARTKHISTYIFTKKPVNKLF